jgi:DNA recombination protein RmuC
MIAAILVSLVVGGVVGFLLRLGARYDQHHVRTQLQASTQALANEVHQLEARLSERHHELRTLVTEELHTTLGKRVGDSFQLVDSRLEAVQRGLGEMQVLAGGVGDLKRMLGNVKIRGMWAEVQLGSLLEQTLAPSQYLKNAKCRADSKDMVEFVIRLPGDGTEVWLPIDSKFPQGDASELRGVGSVH